MKVFIAGATGVLGRRLIKQFQSRGHSVVGLTRDARGDQVVRSLGGEPRQADLFDAGSLTQAAQGAEVVIHAATSIPVKDRTAPADWAMNDRIRREGTRALTSCAAEIGAGLYLQQSIVWVASPPDGLPFDEDSTPHPNPVTLSALEGEEICQEAGDKYGFNVSILRCGWFYGADSAHTRRMGEGLLKRRLPVVGRGDAVWSCLHLDDAAGAFVTAAEVNRNGLWHVVDNEQVTVSEFLAGLSERIGAAPPRRVPVWLARLIAGEYTVNILTSSTRTSNARFRGDTGWTPRYPSYREGLDQVAAAWASEGFPEGNVAG